MRDNNNNNNNNGRIWRVVGVFVAVFFVIVGVVYAYGTLNSDVEHNTETNAKQDLRLIKIEDAGAKRDQAITEIKYIKESVEYIKKRIDE